MKVHHGWDGTLLVALEAELRERMQRAQEGGAETPMDRWWKHGGVMFKDE